MPEFKDGSWILDDSTVDLYDRKHKCLSCRHYIQALRCDAFDQIPEEIWSGKNDHTKPFPNDKGITFEPLAINSD